MNRCAVKKMIAIITLSLMVALGLSVMSTSSTFALTYSQDIGVNFTFNSSVRLSLSSADLRINELAPGAASDSNIITVGIFTNNANGYTLSASVGNNTAYNTRNLIHRDSTVVASFASVDYTTTPTITTNTNLVDNTWAYSYSTDAGSSWANYNGLPLYSDETHVALLKESSTPVASISGDEIRFKIAAKAATSQISGEYNNVINFTLVATPVPKTLEMAYEEAGKEKLNGYYKMQDMSASICNAAEVLDEESQMQAIDVRDRKTYWITKLRDGKCWMTQNLDLDIDADAEYTDEDTDIEDSVSGLGSTYETNDTTWSNANDWPESYDPGNKIWDGTIDFRGETTLDNMTQGANTHYHIGNYYNWTAAVAALYTGNNAEYDIDQSICPAGWTLPKGGPIDGSPEPGSFQYLVEQYGWDENSYTMEDTIWEAPLYFTLGGAWHGDSLNVATSGEFLSSVSVGYGSVFVLGIGPDGMVEPDLYDGRGAGLSVRCVSR